MLSDDPAKYSRIRAIPDQFGRDPASILAALAKSQRDGIAEDVTVVITLVEAQNIQFPPHEFSARWRFAHAGATVSRTAAHLTSRIYYSASRERFTEIASRGRVLTLNASALRDEFGHRFFDQLKLEVIGLSEATQSMMALRNLTDRAYEAGDFRLRHPRDWLEFLANCIVEFYPAAATEIRLQRYPWEALPAAHGSFLAQVTDTAARIRDPTAAIKEALAPS